MRLVRSAGTYLRSPRNRLANKPKFYYTLEKHEKSEAQSSPIGPLPLRSEPRRGKCGVLRHSADSESVTPGPPGDSLSEHQPESPNPRWPGTCSYCQWHHDCDKNRRKDPNKYHPSVKFAAVSTEPRYTQQRAGARERARSTPVAASPSTVVGGFRSASGTVPASVLKGSTS